MMGAALRKSCGTASSRQLESIGPKVPPDVISPRAGSVNGVVREEKTDSWAARW